MPNICKGNNKEEYNRAVRVAARAAYIQSGLEKKVKTKLKRIEDKYIPEQLKQLGWLFIIEEVVRTRRVSYTWTF